MVQEEGEAEAEVSSEALQREADGEEFIWKEGGQGRNYVFRPAGFYSWITQQAHPVRRESAWLDRLTLR